MKKKQRRQRPQQPRMPKLRAKQEHQGKKRRLQHEVREGRAARAKAEREHIARTEEMMVSGVEPSVVRWRPLLLDHIADDSDVRSRPRFGSRPYWMDSGRHG